MDTESIGDSSANREEYFELCCHEFARAHRGTYAGRVIVIPEGIGSRLGGGNWEIYSLMIKDYLAENMGRTIFVVCRWNNDPDVTVKPTIPFNVGPWWGDNAARLNHPILKDQEFSSRGGGKAGGKRCA